MTNETDNRVLCRRGARELTLCEVEFVSGAGQFHTLVCTAATAGALASTTTGPGDGDGCSDTDNSFS